MQVHYTSPLMLGYAWFLSLILSAFFFFFKGTICIFHFEVQLVTMETVMSLVGVRVSNIQEDSRKSFYLMG